MSVVSLLCLFFGWLGIHRFYMGKIITGILMILTLGGCGLWSFIDLIFALCGKFHDQQGRQINVSRPVSTGIIIAAILCVAMFFFVPVLLAIAIPQYAKYSRGGNDNVAQSAYHNVALAEEAYFAKFNKYITNYNTLHNEAGLTRDPNVYYGPLIVTAPDGYPTFTFTVRHKAPGSTTYFYNSGALGTDKVRTYNPGSRYYLEENTWQ
jgi:Tfp pilus assembly protein PilE